MTTHMHASALEKALPAIVGMIVEDTGIKVVRADRAATTGNVVYLPRRGTEMHLTELELVKTVGFIYHEGSHILHSNFTLAAETPIKRAITGILEDIRIEHLSNRKFPGSSRYLARLVGIMVEEAREGRSGFVEVTSDTPEAAMIQRYMLYRLRNDILGQTAIQPVLQGALREADSRLPVGLKTRLDALMFQVTDCDTEDEVFQLADEIITMIKEEKQKEEEKQKQAQQEQAQQEQEQQQQQQQKQQQAGEGQDSGQSGESGEAQPGDGNDQSGEDSTSPGNSSQQAEGQGGEDENSSAPGNSAGEGDDDGKSASGKSGSGNEDGESEGQDQGSAGGGAGEGNPAAEMIEQLLSMSDEDVEQDLGEMLQEMLNQAAEDDSGYRSVQMPNVQRPRLAERPVDMGVLRASVNATRTRTMQWMASAAEEDVAHSRAGMLIDSSRIWQSRLGGSLFIRSDEGIDLNAAVSVVIDRSGSMSAIIGSAVQAAIGTMLAFDVPGIQTQVSVFPWHDDDGGEAVAVVKHWEQSAKKLAGSVNAIGADGGTPMAEAVLWASSDIVRRDETLKLIMVVTDGDPNDPAATVEMIRLARNNGITVVGLGIGVDPSGVFGEKYSARLNHIGELSSAMVKLVKVAFGENR